MGRLYYGHIQSNDLKLHYYRTSDEKPVMVMLHGISDYSLCWSRVALKFEPSYDLLLPDARGHGLSSAPSSGYTLEALADDVASLIHQLELPPALVIGHSLGGSTAAVLAVRYPHLVRAIILEDPPYTESRPTPQELAGSVAGFETWINGFKNQNLAEIMAICQVENPHWDEEDIRQWAKGKLAASPSAAEALKWAGENWREIIQQIHCQVLVVTGDPEQGAIITPDVSQEIRQLCSGAIIEQIHGAGHSIHRDQYKSFIQTLRNYI